RGPDPRPNQARPGAPPLVANRSAPPESRCSSEPLRYGEPSMRARSLVAALAIAVRVVTPASALAAPPPPAASAADLAAAKKLFATGLKLYNEGSFREALSAFTRANAIAPRASLQRNIAQCHRDLKDFGAAYDAYQTLLAQYGASMSAADRRSVQHAIDELATLTGTIRVDVTEAGAAVSLDDHDAGTTPLAGA